MTLQEFLDKYLGTIQGYPDGQYVGECLSICKKYIYEVFGINPPPSGTNSAYGYWSNFPSPLETVFEKVENTSDLIPQKGWIAIWKPWSTNQYGHIGIVAEGCTTGTLKNYAQNWSSKTFQLESNRYTNVVGFLKPKVINLEEEMTEEQKRILDFIGDRTEGDVRQAFGALADQDSKDKQIQTLNAKVLDLEQSQKNLEDRILALESNIEADLKLITDWQSKCQTANKQLDNVNKQLDDMTTEKNKYKGYYENKCDELKSYDKMTPFQHILYGLKLLIKK